MSRARYITIFIRVGTMGYVTGRKKSVAKRTKIIRTPILDDSTNYHKSNYDCMEDWYGTQEFKEWVRNEA